MKHTIQTTLILRRDALDRARSAVAGARAKGHVVSLQGFVSEALERCAKDLEESHNSGKRFPPGKLRPGRLPARK